MESAILTPKRTEYGKAIRKAYESGEIRESRHNMTELEPRKDGISNTLTTVQKDNLLLEVKQIENMDNNRENFENPQCGRVYGSEGLSPTINTCQGGQREPKVIVKNIPCKLNKMPNGHLDSLKNAEICDIETPTASTITARYCKGVGAHKDNMCIVAMRGRDPDNPSDRTAWIPTEQRLELNSQGICNTLTSVHKDNMVLENVCINDRGFSEKEPQITVGIAPTLRAETHGNLPKVIETQYRIRKLTPLECWRLMGFSDEDFHKAEKVNSNSQLYKQAGNSVVKNVLMAIFGQMISEKENEYKE